MKRSKQPKSTQEQGRLFLPCRAWLAGATMVLVVTIVYWPTLDNGFVSDDHVYVENNVAIQSLQGLANIWFKLGTVEQYYPLVFSTYWAEYHLWGLDPLGYHVVNLLLHATTAVLVWQLLVRLAVPGAWLAAVIFAVHPVHVESVAWVTERKNVLSCALALGSLLMFLRFSPPENPGGTNAQVPAARGHWGYYALAFALYVAALLAKTATASVPAVLLVIYWWKQGRVALRDAARLAPFFVVGLALAPVTVSMEKSYGAVGEEWDFSLIEHLLIAGRALWFYAGKLVWPHPLILYHPRWVIDAHVWWQYLFPAAALAVLASLWWARTRIGRGPLAAVLIFAGVLTPALGFFHLFMFRFSFVADHYQYHASIALIALAAAAVVLAAGRLAEQARWFAPLVGAGLLLPLALVAQHKTHVYRDDEALGQDVLTHDPQCWLVHHNYGCLLQRQGNYAEAMSHFRKEFASREQLARDNPTKSIYKNNVAANFVDIGLLHREMGRPVEAQSSFHKAIEIREKLVRDYPTVSDYQHGLAWSHVHLGLAQHKAGRLAETAVSYRRSIEIRQKLTQDNPSVGQYPDELAASYVDLGLLQRDMGQQAEAESSFRKALEIRAKLVRDHPTVSDYQDGLAWCHVDLALVQNETGQPAEAEVSYRKAIEIRQKLVRDHPTNAAFRSNLASDLARCGNVLALLGKWSQSADRYAQAVAAGNDFWQTMGRLALVQLAAGNEAGYRATCAELVRRHADNTAADAAFSIVLTLVVGERALDDMNQVLALAKRAADADPSNPMAAILVGVAQYRTGDGKQAIATLTGALSQFDPAASSAAAKPDQALVGRVVGEMILALAYHQRADREALQKQLEALRTLLDTTETPEASGGALPPWAARLAVEIAKRELAKLSVPADVPPLGS